MTTYRSTQAYIHAPQWRQVYAMDWTTATPATLTASATHVDDLGATWTKAVDGAGAYTSVIGANGWRHVHTRGAASTLTWAAPLADVGVTWPCPYTMIAKFAQSGTAGNDDQQRYRLRIGEGCYHIGGYYTPNGVAQQWESLVLGEDIEYSLVTGTPAFASPWWLAMRVIGGACYYRVATSEPSSHTDLDAAEWSKFTTLGLRSARMSETVNDAAPYGPLFESAYLDVAMTCGIGATAAGTMTFDMLETYFYAWH